VTKVQEFLSVERVKEMKSCRAVKTYRENWNENEKVMKSHYCNQQGKVSKQDVRFEL